MIPLSKVSVSVSTFETEFIKSQSQSQSKKSGLAHPCPGGHFGFLMFSYKEQGWLTRGGTIPHDRSPAELQGGQGQGHQGVPLHVAHQGSELDLKCDT